MRAPPGEEIKRRKACFDRLLALVVDDADVQELLAKPSWVLETSPGKWQVGFFLDREDVQCAHEPTVTRLVTRIAERGLIGGDLSGNNIVRYVRLPCGENQKPRESGHFKTVLHIWNPGARYTLEDAAGALGIDLGELLAEPESAISQGTGAFHGEQDSKLQAATADLIAGVNLHDATNLITSSLIASGAQPGAVVNIVRGLMHASQAPRDARWQSRYDDISRSVQTAVQKFSRPTVDNGRVGGQAGGLSERAFKFTHARELTQKPVPVVFLVDELFEERSLILLLKSTNVEVLRCNCGSSMRRQREAVAWA